MEIVINQVQKLTGLIMLWISLPVFLMTTNPETLPIIMLLIPFVLLGAALYKTGMSIFTISFRQLPRRRLKIMSAVVAVLPTLLLVLASIQQLTIRDTAIVSGLLLLLVFYMRRIDFLSS